MLPENNNGFSNVKMTESGWCGGSLTIIDNAVFMEELLKFCFLSVDGIDIIPFPANRFHIRQVIEPHLNSGMTVFKTRVMKKIGLC